MKNNTHTIKGTKIYIKNLCTYLGSYAITAARKNGTVRAQKGKVADHLQHLQHHFVQRVNTFPFWGSMTHTKL